MKTTIEFRTIYEIKIIIFDGLKQLKSIKKLMKLQKNSNGINDYTISLAYSKLADYYRNENNKELYFESKEKSLFFNNSASF